MKEYALSFTITATATATAIYFARQCAQNEDSTSAAAHGSQALPPEEPDNGDRALSAEAEAVLDGAVAEGAASLAKGDAAAGYAALSRGITLLLVGEGASREGPLDVPIVDFGLNVNETIDALLLSGVGGRIPPPGWWRRRLGALLVQRAEAALVLDRVCRALADSGAALALAPTMEAAVCRARALLAMGDGSRAADLLAPYTSEPAVHLLAETAAARAARAGRAAFRLEGSVRPPCAACDLAFIGPITLQQLGNGTRGWVATRPIDIGSLLLVEPAVFPHAPPSTPLVAAIARRLCSGGLEADRLRDFLACMQPPANDESLGEGGGGAGSQPTGQELAAVAQAAAMAGTLGIPLGEARRVCLAVPRNQTTLLTRERGEQEELGTGLFPLSAIVRHSCHPNSLTHVVSGGCALVTRAVRDIAEGEEVCRSFSHAATAGHARRQLLRRTHGFECACERCDAAVGSDLFELEREQLALACPLAGANGHNTHALLPSNPYAASPSFACSVTGCPARLSAADAKQQLEAVYRACVALNRLAELGADPEEACRVARHVEEVCQRMLGPRNHSWMLWIPAALAVAGSADDTELLLQVCGRKEALLVPCRAGDDDVYARVTHALAAGLETTEGASALRDAFVIERVAIGVDVEGFVHRWVPHELDFELAAPEMFRILHDGAISRKYTFEQDGSSEIQIEIQARAVARHSTFSCTALVHPIF